MAPFRAHARASEAIVAETTMINAYSVVWLPVSGSNGRDAVCGARDRLLMGMKAPSGCGDDG
jgi:hypothetical protein